MSRQVCPGGSVTLVCLAAGGPNSNDLGTNHILHHTIGSTDWHQEFRCFKEVTCAQVGVAKPCEACTTTTAQW